jgi:hypothetical protein
MTELTWDAVIGGTSAFGGYLVGHIKNLVTRRELELRLKLIESKLDSLHDVVSQITHVAVNKD